MGGLGRGRWMGERWVGLVELKRERGGSGGRGGARSRNRQRDVQAIVVTPLNKLHLSECLKNTPPTLSGDSPEASRTVPETFRSLLARHILDWNGSQVWCVCVFMEMQLKLSSYDIMIKVPNWCLRIWYCLNGCAFCLQPPSFETVVEIPSLQRNVF